MMVYMMTLDDTDSLDALNEFVDGEAAEAARVEAKPPIDHLKDAIAQDAAGNPVFLAGVGDKIVIERVASVLTNKPWLDTKTYRVQSIDTFTGNVMLLNADENFSQTATTNYITGPQRGYRFKLANSKGISIGKRKRGRPRKNPVVAPPPVQLDSTGEPVKKKRGRPAGSKNRSKDIVLAEKKTKLAEKRAKKIARAAKLTTATKKKKSPR